MNKPVLAAVLLLLSVGGFAQPYYQKTFSGLEAIKLFDYDGSLVLLAGRDTSLQLQWLCIDKNSGQIQWKLSVADTSFISSNCDRIYTPRLITTDGRMLTTVGTSCFSMGGNLNFSTRFLLHDTDGHVFFNVETLFL